MANKYTRHWAQESEDDAAKIVVTCDPGMPSFVAGLHPAASLFENPLNLDVARQQHTAMRNALSDLGATVYTVSEILKEMDIETLRKLAALRLQYLYEGSSAPPLAMRDFLTDSYKASVGM